VRALAGQERQGLVELIPLKCPAADEILTQELGAVGGGHVQQPATLQVDFLALQALAGVAPLHE
jgi:hypothetical protein